MKLIALILTLSGLGVTVKCDEVSSKPITAALIVCEYTHKTKQYSKVLYEYSLSEYWHEKAHDSVLSQPQVNGTGKLPETLRWIVWTSLERKSIRTITPENKSEIIDSIKSLTIRAINESGAQLHLHPECITKIRECAQNEIPAHLFQEDLKQREDFALKKLMLEKKKRQRTGRED